MGGLLGGLEGQCLTLQSSVTHAMNRASASSVSCAGRPPVTVQHHAIGRRTVVAGLTLILCWRMSTTARVAPQLQPSFRSTTTEVEVDATILGVGGRPVLDLSPSEIEITEDDQPRAITTFQLVNLPVPPHTASVPIDSDVVTNLTTADRQVWVFAIVDLHVRRERVPAIQRLARELLLRIGPFDLAAVVTTSGQLSAMREFTGDRRVLLQALDRVESRYEPRLGRTIFSGGSGNDPIPDLPSHFNDLRTTSVLADIAKHLTDITARAKNIVFISEGSFYSVADPCLPVLPWIVSAGSKDKAQPPPALDVAIKSDACMATVAASSQSVRIYGLRIPPIVHDGRDRSPVDSGSLSTFANTTGGIAASGIDPIRALDRILKYANAFYVIGYRTDSKANDRKYHRIKVHVNRRGIAVIARQGYLAAELRHPVEHVDESSKLKAAISDVVPRVFSTCRHQGVKRALAPVETTVTVVDRSGREWFRQERELPIEAFRSDRSADIDLALPASQFPVGLLVLRIRARLIGLDSSIEQAVPFTVKR